MMNIEKFHAAGKEAALYHAEKADSPLLILNHYEGDGRSVMEAAGWPDSREFNLLCVSNLNWDQEMTPWYCPPVMAKGSSYAGGADAYLQVLVEEILPGALARISGKPAYIGIAGYSLAGLFALYALYRTDVFARAASISGSLWYPDFREYVLSHEMKRKPDKLYLSLGDKEARTRNPYLGQVQKNTEMIADHYRNAGIDVVWELNPGNHFKDPEKRTARGIRAIL